MSSTWRHPKALPYLFLTEMWERFGFYVIQGMLVLYMTKAYGFSDDRSYTILGVFTALAYISPMLGGFLADRFLGFKTAITWGGIFLSVGYALLAVTWSGGFYLGLATVIVGNGLFKPNISSLLGALYQPGDPGRDSGFTIFYMGINLGILLAGIGSGIIKDLYGWHASFAAACLGLIVGLGIFLAGLKWGDMKYQSHYSQAKSKWLCRPALLTYCLLTVGLISYLLQGGFLGKWLLPTIGIILLFFVFSLAFRQQGRLRSQLLLLNVLIISSVVFWTVYLQMFFSVNLFIDRLIDKEVFGMNIPTTFFYTLEGLFVILLGPLFAWSWLALNRNQQHFPPLLKFILGIVFAGLGFLALAVSTYFTNTHLLVSPLWIVLSYLLIAIGELLLSPIGLSAVTLLSPPQLTGMMMGIWFVALGFGGQFAGIIAKLSSIPDIAVNQLDMQLSIYRHAFFDYAYLAFGVAALLFVLQNGAKWLQSRAG